MMISFIFQMWKLRLRGAEWLGLLTGTAFWKSNLRGLSGGCRLGPWDARPMGRWAGSFDDWPIPGPGPSDCWWPPLAWSSLSPALLFLHLWVSLGLLGSG